jgi:hypothetical protein
MTTPDSFGTGGATNTHAGGLAAGPGDDQGDAAVTAEAESGRPRRGGSTPNKEGAPGTQGGLATAGDTGPDLTEDDEETAANKG